MLFADSAWAALGLLLVFALTGCAKARAFVRRHRAKGPVLTAAQRTQIRHGREVYQRHCALCHGADGRGYRADHANAIGNPVFLATVSDAFLRESIVDGRPGTPMSAWGRANGGPLDDATVNDLIAYLRTFSRGPRVDVERVVVRREDPAGARAVWAERCASCHGANGRGSERATSLSHPNFLRSASDGFLRYTIEHGRPGTPMGSFAMLPPQTLDALVALVRTFEYDPRPQLLQERFTGDPPPSLENLVINPTGAAPQFTLREDRFVPAAQVAQALADHKRMVILDARATSDWNMAHIPGAAPFPFYDVEQLASRLPRDGTWIVAYCACPHAASGHVVDELRRRNFRNTAVLDEGILHWLNQHYPAVRANDAPAAH